MISILDYGAGNLRSVQNTLSEIGAEFKLVHDAAGLRSASKILLPGVGHFGQMMRSLDEMKVRETLVEKIAGGTPFFGICLGMQALFEESDEAPGLKGLGIFPGQVKRFPDTARVPHMGWNTLSAGRPSQLLHGLGVSPYVYFAHSYYVPETGVTSATCTYSLTYTAVLEARNVYGVQFHPEKSGAAGLSIVRNFIETRC
jgi:imidazole glycerol phosphate synthase glutamine amidotransferase subunit